MKKKTEAILSDLVQRRPELAPCRASIEEAFSLMRECYEQGHKVLVCGNGGSAADAEHIVGELMKGFWLRRPLAEDRRAALEAVVGSGYEAIADRLQGALPAISLVSHTSLATAIANDVSADMVFAQQVFGYGRPGDVLIAISTSGRSANVVNAVLTGSAFGVGSIGLTGEAESPLSAHCTVSLRVPARETAAIQEYHLMVYHVLCGMVECELFDR